MPLQPVAEVGYVEGLATRCHSNRDLSQGRGFQVAHGGARHMRGQLIILRQFEEHREARHRFLWDVDAVIH